MILPKLGLMLMLLAMLSLACTSSSWSREYGSTGAGIGLTLGRATALEERIAVADLIVKARLQSFTAGSVLLGPSYPGEDWGQPSEGDNPVHIGTMNYTFSVVAHLKGSDGNELVAVVLSDNTPGFLQTGDAVADGQTLVNTRQSGWDNRDAILFLQNDLPGMVNFPADRYGLGWYTTCYGNIGDAYCIHSPSDRNWLPAATTSGSSRSRNTGTGSQRFLMDAPSDTCSDNLARSTSDTDSSGSITLNSLKGKISSIEQEVTAGGSSAAYRECIAAKYELQSYVDVLKARWGGTMPTFSLDGRASAGLPAGSVLWESPDAYRVGQRYEETTWGVTRSPGERCPPVRCTVPRGDNCSPTSASQRLHILPQPV